MTAKTGIHWKSRQKNLRLMEGIGIIPSRELGPQFVGAVSSVGSSALVLFELSVASRPIFVHLPGKVVDPSRLRRESRIWQIWRAGLKKWNPSDRTEISKTDHGRSPKDGSGDEHIW
jgi:hypothetical protein